MRSAKSTNSVLLQQQQNLQQQNDIRRQVSNNQPNNNSSATSPICRCRVMYLGSSVPHITKDGLQGIQEPLRELYPDKATLASGNAGIDSWLSVWSNGILIENVDETGREVKRFFKIDALHYCAAVKYVSHPINPYNSMVNGNLTSLPKFLPLDSPHARQAEPNPPIFASILRRTTGIKVLECHAFICKREAAANALVRCCFHAYADTMYAKQIGADVNAVATDMNNNRINGTQENHRVVKQKNQDVPDSTYDTAQPLATRRSKSIAGLNDVEQYKSDAWQPEESNGQQVSAKQLNNRNLIARRKSINDNFTTNCDNTDNTFEHQQLASEKLRNQQKLSKSMHHLNQRPFESEQNSITDQWQNGPDPRMIKQVPQQPFYNPYASRVPSYPPQSLIDANNGGTLRSIRSMAANSIASTLLRSKKHAKAMSMAQLNRDKITSFHQPHSNASTMIAPMMMPPVPPNFLPNLANRPIMSGSHTMKVPNRPMMPINPAPIKYEAITPKEMKKMLKKSAKYGIDPSKFAENGLPMLPMRSPQLPPPCHIAQHSKSGTMISQSMLSDMYINDGSDMSSIHGLPQPMRGPMMEPHDQPLKPILVKPNPEFLKSKAGKKWLKQQKEFKKLLPPHLDGLPIIFGPPPVDALEPANIMPDGIQPPTFLPPHPGLPVMDSSGFYNPYPLYSQNGRASAASTLIRYSPHSQMIHDNSQPMMNDLEYAHRNQMIYGNISASQANSIHDGRSFVGDDSSVIFNGANCDNESRRSFAYNNLPQQSRNHMVEQSVISLGDENDYDDDQEGDSQNGYYDPSSRRQSINSQLREMKNTNSGSNSMRNHNNDNHMVNYHDKGSIAQQQYDQPIANQDDQGSYSSGIYKRGHMNERAFSYSIRQESKSGCGSSELEYSSQNDNGNHNRMNGQEIMTNNHQHQGNMYRNKHNRSPEYHHHDMNQPHVSQVNELSARLENQLNMKSFAGSQIKSHI